MAKSVFTYISTPFKLYTPLTKLTIVVLPQRSLLARAKLSPFIHFSFLHVLFIVRLSTFFNILYIYVNMYICMYLYVQLSIHF